MGINPYDWQFHSFSPYRHRGSADGIKAKTVQNHAPALQWLVRHAPRRYQRSATGDTYLSLQAAERP